MPDHDLSTRGTVATKASSAYVGSRRHSQETLVSQETPQPDQTVNNPALESLMHSLGEALLEPRVAPASKACIDNGPRDSFVRRKKGGFGCTGNWEEIASGVKEVSRQWSACGDTLGTKAGMDGACNEARDSANTLDAHASAINSVIRHIPNGSLATLQEFKTIINDLAGTNEKFNSRIPGRDLSHLWSNRRKVRSMASFLDRQSIEALLDIYRQQQAYEQATGISGEVSYGKSLRESLSEV